MFKVKGQSSRSQRNVTYKQQKRSKTATDRLSDFELGTFDEIKSERDCAASGCLKLQCIRNCHVFWFLSFFVNAFFSEVAQMTPIKSIHQIWS